MVVIVAWMGVGMYVFDTYNRLLELKKAKVTREKQGL